MDPNQEDNLELRPPKESPGRPAPERTGFAFGSLLFGTLSLLATLLLDMTTFGTIMAAMGIGYALVARASQRRMLVLAGAAVSLVALFINLSKAGIL
jgi:hypothetical protein